MKYTIAFDSDAPKSVAIETPIRITGTVCDSEGRRVSDVYLDFAIIEGSGVFGSVSACSDTYGEFFVESVGAEPGTLTIHARSSEFTENFETISIECEEVTTVATKPAPKSAPPRPLSELPLANGTVAQKAPYYVPEVREIVPAARMDAPPPPSMLADLDPLELRSPPRSPIIVTASPEHLDVTSVMDGAAQEELNDAARGVQTTAAEAETIVVSMDESSETAELLNAMRGIDSEPAVIAESKDESDPSLDELSARAHGTSRTENVDNTFTRDLTDFVPSNFFTAPAAAEEEEPESNVVTLPVRHRLSTWLIAVGAAAALALATFTSAHLASNDVVTASMAVPAPQAATAPTTQTIATAAPCDVTAIVVTEKGYDYHCR